ncbi:MAG: imelysin family protein [Phaeodactylibacter sp.]|nr:imelysin family protein [Phaeodactylibacter sp.]MCB9263714.1 imelysin family protein [Lewinellaceae bacterium]MCB9286879.1 imelysin family protein [Lewinellaceae bacterium]
MLPNRQFYLPFLLLGILILSSCGEDGRGNPCESDFDQQSLFTNVADNIIIPGYEKLNQEFSNLRQAAILFEQMPGPTQLNSLREAFSNAYIQWQGVAQFGFGPAEEQMLRPYFNNFPLNAEEVEAKIQSGELTLSGPGAYDKGFPALDYLLFGLAETDEMIVDKLAGAQQPEYLDYFLAIVLDMEQRSLAVEQAWKQGGYREAFIDNTGTAAGTSLSLLINNLNEQYEFIKRDKVGIPSGVTTLGITFPEKVEAYYSGLSLRLAEEALNASEGLFLGRNVRTGANGPGLDDYLQAVNATKEGQNLSRLIEDQFEKALEAFGQIEPPLAGAISADNEAVVNAYNEITRQLVNIKTDMPSVLCVAITYVDNASDSD